MVVGHVHKFAVCRSCPDQMLPVLEDTMTWHLLNVQPPLVNHTFNLVQIGRGFVLACPGSFGRLVQYMVQHVRAVLSGTNCKYELRHFFLGCL